ncbi:carboxyltransferase domain-containing protein [Vibrio sp. FNV 38]|nr:carboxyltransferase domain-containing protein [Vibrio sp. FNV 38]
MKKERIDFNYQLVSENSVFVSFMESPCRELSQLIGYVAQQLHLRHQSVLMNVTPSHTTILIDYLPHRVSVSEVTQSLSAILHNLLSTSGALSIAQHEELELPAYYSPEVGLDIDSYEEQGISLAQLCECHCSSTYYISALGFSPGFAFMAGLDSSLARPRLSTPRVYLPRGSIGIADEFTAIYPNDSPGGWNIVGNCPTTLYNPNKTPVTPFKLGTAVRFRAISQREFLDLGGRINTQGTK